MIYMKHHGATPCEIYLGVCTVLFLRMLLVCLDASIFKLDSNNSKNFLQTKQIIRSEAIQFWTINIKHAHELVIFH